MVAKVAASAAPWSTSWARLTANSHASLSYSPHFAAVLSRGNDGVHADNSSSLFNDVAAAYQCALRWKISGDTAYADKAVSIMNGWSATLTAIYGTSGLNGDNDGILMAGIQGYQFANAAEIMRGYAGWADADFKAFQQMMLTLFYPINHSFMTTTAGLDPILVYSNWELCSIASIMSIGVLCDDSAKFNEALGYFKSGLGNGAMAQTVYYLHPGYLGQTQESGRDQGHNTLSIALLGVICEMAWNQGIDLYGYRNNLALAAAEYVAKGNLASAVGTYDAVPYALYKNHNVSQSTFSIAQQGTKRPEWALIYNHYVNRAGLAAPHSKAFAELMSPEGGGGDYGSTSGGFDQLGFGTLAFWRDPIAKGALPSGLTAVWVGGSVVLSWWGSADASSYNVKRASSGGGPYTNIATGITDLLTYTDTPTTPGQYFYVVTAIVAGTESAASNAAIVQTATTLHTRLSLDDGSGTAAIDGSGNGHAGSLTGGTSWSSAGYKSGVSALAFDGASGCVSLPDNLATELGDFSIAVWVYWTASATNVSIFSLGNDIDRYIRLTPRDVNGVMRLATTVNGYDAEFNVVSSAALPTNQWVHLVVTLSGDTARLYVNGAEQASSTTFPHAPFRLGPTQANSLGRPQKGGQPYFKGRMNDFRIYTAALGAAEVAALYAS